jgi:hypothetical protein
VSVVYLGGRPGRLGAHPPRHGTFLAGLIRLAAPDAQVLSMRVMSDLGQVSETNVVAALTWLTATCPPAARST